MVEHLPNMSKTMGSIPSMKKQEDEEEKDREGKRCETQLSTKFQVCLYPKWVEMNYFLDKPVWAFQGSAC